MRIHVERLIGVLKQKYTILQSRLPISSISDKEDNGASTDKMLIVRGTLVNLFPSVVPHD